MRKEKLQEITYFVIASLGITAFAFIFIRYLLVLIMPFLIGWLAAFVSRAPAMKLMKRSRVPARIWRLIIALVVIAAGVSLVFLLGRFTVGELWNLLSKLGEGDSLSGIINGITEQMLGIFGRLSLPPELEASVKEALSGVISSVLSSLGGFLTGVVAAIPRILLFIGITLIVTVYFSLDLDKINAVVKKILPNRAVNLLVRIRNGALSVLIKYLRSYFLIMLVTFAVMLVGFLILGVEYAFLFAIIVSLLDVLPVIGVGTALIPASIFSLLSGNRFLGIGLLLLFAVNESGVNARLHKHSTLIG
jgi:predicted PurR-regulated permease PerM